MYVRVSGALRFAGERLETSAGVGAACVLAADSVCPDAVLANLPAFFAAASDWFVLDEELPLSRSEDNPSCVSAGDSSVVEDFEMLLLKPLRLKPVFFSGAGGRPAAARAICRTSREMGESSRASGTAVVCMRRTAA